MICAMTRVLTRSLPQPRLPANSFGFESGVFTPRPPEPAAASAASGPSSCFTFLLVWLWAANEGTITWGRRHVDPSRRLLWNNLDCDILRYHTPLVTHQVHVSAAYVGETLACCVDLGRAGGVGSLVNRERPRYDSDQAGTRMRVPPSVSPNWERVLGDIEVRISLRLQFQVPVEERSVDHGIDFIARQVEH